MVVLQMGRKRMYAQKILDVLGNHGRSSFTQIKKWIEEDFGLRVSATSLSDNLIFLIDQGLVRREELTKKGNLRGDIKYARTEKYVNQKMRSTLVSAMKEIDPIRLLVPTSGTFPMFLLGSEKRENIDFISGLWEAALKRFKFEVEKTIVEKFEETDRGRIKLILGKLWWANYKDSVEWFKEKEEKHGREPPRLFQNLSLVQSAKQLLEIMQKEGSWVPGISMPIMQYFPKIYDKMLDYKWRLLGEVAPYVAFEQLEDVKGNNQEIIDFLSRDENQKMLSKFLEEMNKTKFALLVSVGFDQFDKLLWVYLLEDFENWNSSLREGKLDNREWIFDEGANNLWKFIRYLKKKEKHPFRGGDLMTRRLPQSAPLQVDKGESWDLMFLYDHHPRGRSIAFYEEIRELIDERRKQKMQNEASTEKELDLFF